MSFLKAQRDTFHKFNIAKYSNSSDQGQRQGNVRNMPIFIDGQETTFYSFSASLIYVLQAD